MLQIPSWAIAVLISLIGLCLTAIGLLSSKIKDIKSGSGLQLHLIALFNTFVVMTSAMGTYEVTFKKGDEAKKLAASNPTPPA